MFAIACQSLLPVAVGGKLAGEDVALAVRLVRQSGTMLQRPVTPFRSDGTVGRRIHDAVACFLVAVLPRCQMRLTQLVW
jgi:hypothetical protein